MRHKLFHGRVHQHKHATQGVADDWAVVFGLASYAHTYALHFSLCLPRTLTVSLPASLSGACATCEQLDLYVCVYVCIAQGLIYGIPGRPVAS